MCNVQNTLFFFVICVLGLKRKQKRIRSQLFDFSQNLTIESTNFSLTDSILTFGKETSFQTFTMKKEFYYATSRGLAS